MEALREAEQHHIDRLRSRLPEFGFNLASARWTWDGRPAQSADGIPAHASFNLIEIPDDVLLTDVEVAAVGRWSPTQSQRGGASRTTPCRGSSLPGSMSVTGRATSRPT
jgi:hypothetical protein